MSLLESDDEIEGETTDTETETGSVHSDSTITMQAPWIEMRGGDGAVQAAEDGDVNVAMEKKREKEKEKASSPTHLTVPLQRQQQYRGKVSRTLLDNADVYTTGAEKAILPTRVTDSLKKQQQRRAKVVRILEDADVALAGARQLLNHQRAAVCWLCLEMTRSASTVF